MARGRKFKRGGAKAKPEAQVADVKVEQEAADTTEDVAEEQVEQQTQKQVSGSKAANGKGKSKKPLRKHEKGDASKKGGDGGAKSKVADFSGLIFMCNSATKKDCFKYHVFGYPEARKDVIERAKKGIKLFLFDIDQRVLYGVYRASSLGGMNLVSEAFQDSDRKFPAQIRFRIHKDCAPLDESAFKPAIKENYYGRNKFKCELSYEQVGKLLKLFRPLDASGLPKPKPAIAKESRRESFQKSSTARGSRSGVPPRSGRTARPLPPVGQYSQSLVREPLPLEMGLRSQPGYISAHALPYPDIGRLEADALYRQRLQLMQLQDSRADAIERRAYTLDPVLDASLRHVGVSGDFARRRFPDDLHLDERSLLLSKGSLHEDLYRDIPYQKEALYSGRENTHAFSGTLPYKPLSTLPWGYP